MTAVRFAGLGFLLYTVINCVPELKTYERTRENWGVEDPNGEIPEGFTSTNIKLRLSAPAEVTESIKQVEMLIRKQADTGSGCDQLWSTEPSNLIEGSTLINIPQTSDRAIVPDSSGTYDLFIYVFDKQHDLFCQSAAWCEESQMGPSCANGPGGTQICSAEGTTEVSALAGGCQEIELVLDSQNDYRVALVLPPG